MVIHSCFFMVLKADIVQLLLEKNASVEARNKKKETPLDCALNKQVNTALFRLEKFETLRFACGIIFKT